MKKLTRFLSLALALALIAPVLLAVPVSAVSGGTGFTLDSVTNAKFDEYWRNVDIYTIFNSADEGYLLTGWNTARRYMCLQLKTRSNAANGTIPVVVGAMTFYDSQSSLGDYTPGNYPLGQLLPTTYDGTCGESTFVYRNYREAWEAYCATGAACWFLLPTSYVSGYATSSVKYLTACQLNDLGYISGVGTVSYGSTRHMYYSTSSTSQSFLGAYYLPEYLPSDSVSICPEDFTVAAGVAKGVPFWLTDSIGSPYNDPSITWSFQVYSPTGAAVDVDWVSMMDSGMLMLTEDSLPGYDIEVAANWGDGYSKSTTLFIRDLGDPGGSDPEIPDSSGEYEERITALESQVMTLQEDLSSVQSTLDGVNDNLGEIVNGDSGVDSSVTDFSDVSDSLTTSLGDANAVIGSGVDSLSVLVSSDQMLATSTALGSILSAAFVGNEISLCGISGNPFELAVIFFGSIGVIALVVNYVFRKRGGG